MEKKIIKISAIDIEKSLKNSYRQYLVGMLKKPQLLEYVQDEKLEMGITFYDKSSIESPHTHSQAYEYQYMISGFTKYLDIESKTEFSFKKGDFYLIKPGIKYAQKSKTGTKILFIKLPIGNDKIELQPDYDVIDWMKRGIQTIRTDYTNSPDAPQPNSIKPAVAAALFNDKNQILVIKRKDSGNWTLPGGTLEFGEDLVTCCTREIKEETGYKVEILNLIGTYTNPKTVVKYSDGEVRQEFTIVYEGKIIDGTLSLDHESTDYKWIILENVLNLPLAESQRKRITDIIKYKKTREQFLK
ncbi:MAG: NUDIX domain-containing protein [Calditrichaeota bacterium]|nr:MAG: NUDIX domain-containing protein [Calditrichota bacterium]